ncbi:MAG TPA: hypothetical protein VGU45_02015 [Microvirga sp.]|jgi:hypothetical protein|nr:hypothetical protein [Microvirga sp.]
MDLRTQANIDASLIELEFAFGTCQRHLRTVIRELRGCNDTLDETQRKRAQAILDKALEAANDADSIAHHQANGSELSPAEVAYACLVERDHCVLEEMV